MMQFPHWRVDVAVDGNVVKTFYETATTPAAAISKAKHKMRGAVSNAGAFKFKVTKAEASTQRNHASKKSPAQLQREIDGVLAQPSGAYGLRATESAAKSEMDSFNDLNRQGFMRNVYKKPRKPRVPKTERPMVACNGCLNWHREGQHTSNVAKRKATLAGKKLEQRRI